jgi:hypothetical protein
VVPSAIWLELLSPHIHTEPSAVRAIEKKKPAAIAVTLPRPGTTMGVAEGLRRPSPSWPP